MILEEGLAGSVELVDELETAVDEEISPIARPGAIVFTEDLPKTRSGKIMRRLLKDIVHGKGLGDTTTLRNPEIAERLEGAWQKRQG